MGLNIFETTYWTTPMTSVCNCFRLNADMINIRHNKAPFYVTF